MGQTKVGETMNNGSDTSLEVQIKATAEEAKSSIDKLINSITGIGNSLKSTESILNSMYLELGTIEKTATNSTKSVNSNIKSVKSNTDGVTSSAGKLNKALLFTGGIAGLKKLSSGFLEMMDKSINYTEQLNLFNVVFKNIEKNGTTMYSNVGRSATQFQYKMNEAFGTNKTETLKYQALYKSMASNVGISDEYSGIMSEATTKLTNDLSSLYNTSESSTAEALRAGIYAGQTKPLRNYGIDVTQQSLQPIVNELGIKNSDGTYKQVKNFSQAEKEILRYIAVLKQSSVAHGDFANTINSPANQLKIFKNQLVEAKVALTSLFIGSFAKILPYANAILMVIKEISTAIATMLGIKLEDYNTGITTQTDAYSDLGDSVSDATDKVKELKRQTLGFDQINNINENNSDSNTGTTGTTSGGIDQRLLDAIDGYDNGMEKVKSKANDIRDSIMEWLGFTKETDDATGEVKFKFDHITGGDCLGALAVGGVILKGATKLLEVMGKVGGVNVGWVDKLKNITGGILLTFTGLTLNYDSVSGMLSDGVTWQNVIEGLGGTALLFGGTLQLTHSVTISLMVAAISLVPEAGIAISNAWTQMKPYVEENGGLWETWKTGFKIDMEEAIKAIGGAKQATKDFIVDNLATWLSNSSDEFNIWKGVIENIYDWMKGDWKDLSKNLKEDFGIINQSIKDNGGLWQTWKDGVSKIMDDLGLSKFFTKEYWSEKFGKLKNAWEDVKNWFKDNFKLPDLKVPQLPKIKFDVTYSTDVGEIKTSIYKALGLDGWPSFKFSTYANGGFPEDGWFRASQSELIGKFDNGKSVVANNGQIVEGIKSGVYEAVSSAMSQYGGNSSQIDVQVHTDEGTIVDRINQTTKQTGVCPINIPA